MKWLKQWPTVIHVIFFTESRKFKGQNNLSKNIDNASNDTDIANLFGKHYELCHSVY